MTREYIIKLLQADGSAIAMLALSVIESMQDELDTAEEFIGDMKEYYNEENVNVR